MATRRAPHTEQIYSDHREPIDLRKSIETEGKFERRIRLGRRDGARACKKCTTGGQVRGLLGHNPYRFSYRGYIKINSEYNRPEWRNCSQFGCCCYFAWLEPARLRAGATTFTAILVFSVFSFFFCCLSLMIGGNRIFGPTFLRQHFLG